MTKILKKNQQRGRKQGSKHSGKQCQPRLIAWLNRRAALNGDMKKEMAQQLGVTYPYIHQLTTGFRSLENISSHFARACGRYLGIPPVAVMLAAGCIKVEDFLMPEAIGQSPCYLAEGLERIATDPMLGALMPAEAWDAPDSVKTLLVALYEEATQQELFPQRELPGIFRGMMDAASFIEEDEAKHTAWHTAEFFANGGLHE
ncbi:MAG: hypothetical protein C4516_09045 [Oxalobacter sp.]|nr:MAG: hypothetical protein C4516_09045 [Oxalobacter sp.]